MRYPQVTATSHPGYYSNGGSMHLMKHEGYHDNVNSFPHQHMHHHGCLATADHHQTQQVVPAYTQHQMAHFHPAHHHDNKGLAGLQHPQHQYQPPQQDVSRVQLPTATAAVDPRTQVTCLNDVKNQPVYVTSSSLMTSSMQQPISVAETSKALLIDQSGQQYQPQVSQDVSQYPSNQVQCTNSLYSNANQQVRYNVVRSASPQEFQVRSDLGPDGYIYTYTEL